MHRTNLHLWPDVRGGVPDGRGRLPGVQRRLQRRPVRQAGPQHAGAGAGPRHPGQRQLLREDLRAG